MKTEEVKPKDEKIEKPKPQKFYQAFYRTSPADDWYPISNPQDGQFARDNIERTIDNWTTEGTEFKLISYEI